MSMENISFEQAIARLEAVVRALEDGKTSLEEAMKLYEEGGEYSDTQIMAYLSLMFVHLLKNNP